MFPPKNAGSTTKFDIGTYGWVDAWAGVRRTKPNFLAQMDHYILLLMVLRARAEGAWSPAINTQCYTVNLNM